MNNPFQGNGGYIPGLALITNNLGRPEHMVRRKKKRRPIVKVRSKNVAIGGGWTVKSWKWECKVCYQSRLAPTWEKALHQATHHAHNHH